MDSILCLKGDCVNVSKNGSITKPKKSLKHVQRGEIVFEFFGERSATGERVLWRNARTRDQRIAGGTRASYRQQRRILISETKPHPGVFHGSEFSRHRH